jgi:ribosomal protein L28
MFAFSNAVVGKKWVGGNSDASSVARNRRNLAFQKESTINSKISGNTNPNNAILGGINKELKAPGKTHDNTISNALSRVRGLGYIVPPKVSQKYLSNAVSLGIRPSSVANLPLFYLFGNSGKKIKFTAIACDFTGKNIVAGNNSSAGIYISNDDGKTYRVVELSNSNVSMLSCNGSMSVIVGGDKSSNNAFISTDGGNNWRSISNGASVVSCNIQTGQYIIAARQGSNISYSHDFGNTFMLSNNTSYNWVSVAQSSSGKHAVITSSDNGIWKSDDWSTTWSLIPNTNTIPWSFICCDNERVKIFALALDNTLYISSDSGATFRIAISKDKFVYTGLACDLYASRLLLSTSSELYNLVEPYNKTEFEISPIAIQSLTCATISIDGTSISAGIQYGQILSYSGKSPEFKRV